MDIDTVVFTDAIPLVERERVSDKRTFAYTLLENDVMVMLDQEQRDAALATDALLAQECCYKEFPGIINFNCTRKVGHEGRHIALGTYGDVFAIWEQEV
jgi:hypothetical protein